MDLLQLLDFFEPPVTIGFDVQPEKALEFFYAKGLHKSFSYADTSAEEHAVSFTVAKMMDMDLLADVKASLEAALEAGTPFKQWADSIIPTLQAKGWWGKDEAGHQLGSPHRLETIFRTNMAQAYAVGEWEQIRAQEDVAPFLMYDAVDDHRTRPEHAAWDGLVLPVDHSFWRTHTPPNGWNCRCSVIQLSQDELDELGLQQSASPRVKTYTWKNPRTGKVEVIPEGIDPGFAYNPGQARLDHLRKLAQEKAAAMSADAAKAALAGIEASVREAEVVTRQAIEAVRGAAKLSAATKAAERAALAQIEKALAEKTPYLAKAIEQVKGTKAGKDMTATELLAAAKEKAIKAEQSALLANYKQNVLKGNKPNAKQQAAFDALPEEAQQAITDQLNAKLAEIAAEKAAEAELLQLVANPNSLAAKALAKMDLAGKPKVQVLDEIKATVAAQKAKQVAAQNLAGYKKAVLTDKVPTAKQKAAFDALPQDEQQALLVSLEKEKAKLAAEAAKPSAPPPPQAAIPRQTRVAQTDLDPDDLVQTGPQGGSNPGGEFTDTSTGVRWYMKWPDSVEALRNEVLANRLYALAGVDVPEVRLIQFRGRTTIASRIVDGLKVDRATLAGGRVPGAQEHFAVDAWLANWDVIGPDFANTKLNALGRAMRLDPGGALRFRAQGGLKGAAFGDDVLELESMRNAGTNSHAAAVFRHVSTADIEDGVRRILAIPEEKIRALVEEFGPLDAGERAKLLRTLLARREYLAKKYPNARPQAPERVPDARVTEAEQLAIEAARANGMTIPTDSDVIEDHHVVVTTLKGADGKARTRVTLKLRPGAGQKLQKGMVTTSAEAETLADLAPVKEKALEFLKGVGALAKKSEAIRDKDIIRANALLKELQLSLDKIRSAGAALADPAAAAKAVERMEALKRIVTDWTATAKLGQPAKAFAQFDLDAIPARLMSRPPEPAPGTKPWQVTRSFTYNLSNIERGHIRETARTTELPGVNEVREITVDGVRVRYLPYGKGNTITAEGYLQLDLEGVGVDVTRRAFQVFDQIGIPARRPTELDRLELYLERIASIRTLRNRPLAAKLDEARKIPDQGERAEAMLRALNQDAGFDLRTSPFWDPQGRHQAFGHGRTFTLRPDIDTDELAKFEREYVVYHNPTGLSVGGSGVWSAVQRLLEGGGQLASQLDRVRRGVAPTGSSVSSDHRTGGAAYVFTRILGRRVLADQKAPGIYWRARQVARTDAFSYDGDVFGDVDRAKQEARRAKTLAEMARNARSSGNETNFRDTLSLFDDLEKIVLNDRTDYEAALYWLRSHGYTTWPDGRRLEDVLDYAGRR